MHTNWIRIVPVITILSLPVAAAAADLQADLAAEVDALRARTDAAEKTLQELKRKLIQ